MLCILFKEMTKNISLFKQKVINLQSFEMIKIFVHANFHDSWDQQHLTTKLIDWKLTEHHNRMSIKIFIFGLSWVGKKINNGYKEELLANIVRFHWLHTHSYTQTRTNFLPIHQYLQIYFNNMRSLFLFPLIFLLRWLNW